MKARHCACCPRVIHRRLLIDEEVIEVDRPTPATPRLRGGCAALAPQERFALPAAWTLLFYTDGLTDMRLRPGTASALGSERSARELAGRIPLLDEHGLAGLARAMAIGALASSPAMTSPRRRPPTRGARTSWTSRASRVRRWRDRRRLRSTSLSRSPPALSASRADPGGGDLAAKLPCGLGELHRRWCQLNVTTPVTSSSVEDRRDKQRAQAQSVHDRKSHALIVGDVTDRHRRAGRGGQSGMRETRRR